MSFDSPIDRSRILAAAIAGGATSFGGGEYVVYRQPVPGARWLVMTARVTIPCHSRSQACRIAASAADYEADRRRRDGEGGDPCTV